MKKKLKTKKEPTPKRALICCSLSNETKEQIKGLASKAGISLSKAAAEILTEAVKDYL